MREEDVPVGSKQRLKFMGGETKEIRGGIVGGMTEGENVLLV